MTVSADSLDFGPRMQAWAEREASVSGLVLIGSRQRPPGEALEVVDSHSDWDFHVITSNPALFANRRWVESWPGVSVRAYAARAAVIGGVPKVNIVLSDTEVDLVVIPAQVLGKVKLRAAFGLHRRRGWTQRRLQDIAEVIRPGWRFLVGEERWGALYRRAVAEVTDPHLTDDGVRQLAEGFVCDYVWTARKIARGEFRTAQRTIFRELMETNLQLLHELKQRRGERTFTKGRRLEQVADPAQLARMTVAPVPEGGSLAAELERAARTCRELVFSLVGNTWTWPVLEFPRSAP